MAFFSLDSITDIAIYVGLGIGIYLFFFFLGFGLSSLITFQECEKTNSDKNAVSGAVWAVYPTLAWFLIRPFEIIRYHFDTFYLSFDSAGTDRAGWISVGYVLMLACIAGIYNLYTTSKTSVCIPDIDEATRFKEEMLKRQQEKEEALKEAQETTPAVSKVQ